MDEKKKFLASPQNIAAGSLVGAAILTTIITFRKLSVVENGNNELKAHIANLGRLNTSSETQINKLREDISRLNQENEKLRIAIGMFIGDHARRDDILRVLNMNIHQHIQTSESTESKKSA